METNSTSPAYPPPPPPILPSRPAPAPRKGRGWMIFALVLLALLGVSLLINLSQFMKAVLPMKAKPTREAGPRLEEVVLEDHNADAKLAVVEVEGLISQFIEQGGHNMVEVLKAQLKRAKEDKRVKAVLLKVNSPGGEVLAADEISRAIADFQKGKGGKPVVASMGSLAASGGYYIAVPCAWIVANELTITGSIGVILQSWNYRRLMDKVGLHPMVYKSGKFKDMLSGSRDPDQISPEEREMLQALIDETFARFKEVVAEGRRTARELNDRQGVELSADWEEYADGRVLSGKEAYKLGFVDELGDFQVAVKRAKKLAKISTANVVEYRQRLDLSDLFRLFGRSDAQVVKLDVGLEMPQLRAGHLYFLSPTYLH